MEAVTAPAGGRNTQSVKYGRAIVSPLMVCPRCGAAFEGNFCPQCGMPSAAPAAPALAFSVTCPRCGETFQGHFCPRCGLPAGATPYAAAPVTPARVSPDFARALSVLWTVALVGFFVFIAMNFAGLLISPAYIVPGIQSIASGQSANAALTAGDANWTFQALNASAATGTYVASGGNPSGYLEMTLPAGTQVGGEWVQSVQLTGSAPYAADVELDFRSTVPGELVIAVESTRTGLNVNTAAAILPVSASGSWSNTTAIDVSNSIGDPGTYYLKVAFLAPTAPTGGSVGFDNVQMRWATNAVFYFYLPLPLPTLLYLSQDKGQFLAYYAFVVVALVASGLWYTLRERKQLAQAFRAPLENISTRLRSMSGWVAIAQVWLATTFFQAALIILLEAVGASPSSPFTSTATNAWTLLWDYSAASVFEEIAFRMFLIGVPMAVAALVLRAARAGPGPGAGVSGAGRSDLRGAVRYLWGGQLRKESSREARLAAGVLILLSGLLFGVAHAPGWGDWKVLPAFVVGLGMGYVFVRHGIGASILVHFATDGSLALTLEGIGGDPLALFTNLFYLGLAVAGAGFLAWYLLYGWEELRDLRRSYGARIVRVPAAASNSPPPPPGSWGYAPPPPAAPASPSPYGPSPPPAGPPAGPPQTWGAPPPSASPPGRSGMQLPTGYSPTYHPPPYGFPPVRFQCPYCGWVEARYENRSFTCLRCGRTA